MKDDIERIVDSINPEKEDYSAHSLPELAARLKELKEALSDLKEVSTYIQNEHDKLSESVIPERMDEEGVEVMRVKNVGRLQVGSDIRCSVPKDSKLAVQDWLRENGHGSLIAETVNASTFKAFIKECIREGNKYPKDLIKVHPYSKATVVKG